MVVRFLRRIIPFLFSILLFISACSEKNKSDSFSIKGNLTNVDSPFFLIAIEKSDTIAVDTIFVDKKGDFSYTGTVDELSMASLFFNGKSWSTGVFVDKNLSIEVKGDVDSPDLIMINGGAVNDDLTSFKKDNKGLLNSKSRLLQRMMSESVNSETYKDYDTELKNINFGLTTKAREYIEKNPTKIASVVLIQDFCKNNTSVEILDNLLALLRDDAANFSLTKDLLKYSEIAKKSIEGAQAPTLKVVNEHVDFNLDSLKGKFVYLIFTSYDFDIYQTQVSALIKMYKQFRKDGIEFVSVVIDAPEQGLNVPDSIKWKVVYDYAGWASNAVKDYNITEVPFGILIAPDGSIIGRGISHLSVEDKIKYYKESKKAQ